MFINMFKEMFMFIIKILKEKNFLLINLKGKKLGDFFLIYILIKILFFNMLWERWWLEYLYMDINGIYFC